jgi:rubrerythrin
MDEPACGLIPYAREAEARHVLRRINQRRRIQLRRRPDAERPDPRLDTFRCRVCGHWHLGRRSWQD